MSREIDGTTSMSTLKRWIASGWALASLSAVIGVIAGLSLAVRTSSDGADPEAAFSATELTPESLSAEVTWSGDAADLARDVEPATRDELTAAWLRATDALARAADGDPSGLDVWFTGPALADAQQRFERGIDGALATGADRVDAAVATAHDLRVLVYSLDGQIVVLRTASDILLADAADPSSPSITTEAEVIFVLSDGNWRIRNIERLATDG